MTSIVTYTIADSTVAGVFTVTLDGTVATLTSAWAAAIYTSAITGGTAAWTTWTHIPITAATVTGQTFLPSDVGSSATSPATQNPDGSTTSTVSTSGGASATQSSPTETLAPQPNASSGLNTGAIAGIAVATALVGAVIGAAIIFLFLRRRNTKRPQPEYISMYNGQEKDISGIGTTDKLRLHEFLLDAKPDNELGAELRSLGHLIQQHVENNYHLQPFGDAASLIEPLSMLGMGNNTSIPIEQIAMLAADPRTRYHTIQHVIAQVTFPSITMEGISPVSLLPPTVSKFRSLIPPTENHRGSRQAVEVALTRWRQLSAFLLHSNRSDRTPLKPTEDVNTQQAQDLAVTLGRFLRPFVAGNRDDMYEQENHLREVIVECAAFGYVLFSQPSEYHLRFDNGGRQNGIVVCPGLDRVSDEDGRRYPPPAQPIVAPTVEAI
ncbi:hypothetical protein F5Y15DRAFT_404915 [Xylariaceae sp. FL0016]|nr:hypothetical protein F5Y15DRAFT_404915 [Xylariaceae sp. FL0016]